MQLTLLSENSVCAVVFLFFFATGIIQASPTTPEDNGLQIKTLGPGPVEAIVRQKLTEQLKPVHLEVVNESPKHNAPPGTEAHFWIKVVTPMFSTMSLLKRHQTVNEILKEELKNSIHALTLVPRSPEQWDEERGITSPPLCQGDGLDE